MICMHTMAHIIRAGGVFVKPGVSSEQQPAGTDLVGIVVGLTVGAEAAVRPDKTIDVVHDHLPIPGVACFQSRLFVGSDQEPVLVAPTHERDEIAAQHRIGHTNRPGCLHAKSPYRWNKP